jgi:hypothetical protein
VVASIITLGISEGALFYVKNFNVATHITPRIKLKLKFELKLRPVVASTLTLMLALVRQTGIATRRLLALTLLTLVCVSTDSEEMENTHIRKS